MTRTKDLPMSNAVPKRDESAKWETIRRLRYGDFLRFFRHRYGHTLPDDDAGRGDLWLVVTTVSLASNNPKEKMRHVIDLWAPWMSEEERDRYIEHVWGLDKYPRTLTNREIGERLGLTNAEREQLKLWRFLPIDKSDAELAQLAKDRERARRASRRRQRGVRTREQYRAELAARPKPWEAEGVTRRTWERRRKKMSQRVAPDLKLVSHGESETILTEVRHYLATAGEAESQKGLQDREAAEKPRMIAEKLKQMEGKAPSLPEHRPHHATHESSDAVPPEWAARLAAMEKWGAKRRSRA
jgi:hypothetical protein